MAGQFEGQVVLVTGASSGIGRGTALAFAAQGASVMCVGTRREQLQETVDLIEAAGGRASSTTANVASSEDVGRAVRQTIEEFGGLDIAHNNAGVFPKPSSVGDLDLGVWARTLDVNLTGVMNCMQHEILHMRANGGGVIVNTSSNIGAHGHRQGMAAYASSKAAVSTLTAIAALDHIADGVRINAVSPGATATGMSKRAGETDEGRAERLKSVVPIGRVGAVEEVVNAVLWLASGEASFVVGQDIVVDGGVTA